jgi:CDGSH-type Zn-finger protein
MTAVAAAAAVSPDWALACLAAEPMPDPAATAPGPEPLPLPAGVHQLCRCGRSRQGWHCDGAHLGSGRLSYELRLSEPATLLMCRCGRSHRYPLCDGRHAVQPRRPWWKPW